MDEVARVDAGIKRHNDVMALDAERQFNDVSRSPDVSAAKVDERSIFNTWARRGDAGLSAEQRAAIQNTMSTTTTTEGGFTVQTDVAKSLQDALKAYGGVRSVADVFSTAQGNDINWPNSDGTSETGELIAQNTTATAADPVFGSTTLSVYKFSSKIVAVPFELLQDSSLDIEAIIRQRLIDRLGRVQNTYFTTGTGTAQPRGVVTAASSGKVGLVGQTLTVIYDDLVDLKHSVNRAYRANAAFCMNDLSVSVVSKLKETTGRPIWEYSTQIGAPDTLLGHRVAINDDIAVMAANAKSIMFGDCSQYNIRDVANSISMRRFDDSAFALNGQVGFCGWQRSGGNLLDTAACRAYVNSAT